MKSLFFITMLTLTEILITIRFLRAADLILLISELRQTTTIGHFFGFEDL